MDNLPLWKQQNVLDNQIRMSLSSSNNVGSFDSRAEAVVETQLKEKEKLIEQQKQEIMKLKSEMNFNNSLFEENMVKPL